MYFINEETENLRGQVASPMSHSYKATELGIKLQSPISRAQVIPLSCFPDILLQLIIVEEPEGQHLVSFASESPKPHLKLGTKISAQR